MALAPEGKGNAFFPRNFLSSRGVSEHSHSAQELPRRLCSESSLVRPSLFRDETFRQVQRENDRDAAGNNLVFETGLMRW